MAGDLVLTQRSPSLGQALGQSLGLGNLSGLGFESILTFGLAGSPSPANTNADPGGGGSQTQKTLSTGDGPIWTIRWKGDIIAWAVDAGVRLYSVVKGEKIAFVERARESPRADLFLCSLTWSNHHRRRRGDRVVGEEYEELLIGWADLVKIVRVRTRPKIASGAGEKRPAGGAGGGGAGSAAAQAGMETVVEVTKVLRLDCMIAGVAYWPFLQDSEEKEGVRDPTTNTTGKAESTDFTTAPISSTTTAATSANNPEDSARRSSFTNPKSPPTHADKPSQQTTFLLLTYLPTKAMLSAESNTDQRRQPSNPPELRIVTSEGEERSRDVLAMRGSERWGCGDYRIVESFAPPVSISAQTGGSKGKGKKVDGLREKDHGGWLVLSPKGVVFVRKRDRRDRVVWLVERERYEEALDEMEKMEVEGDYVKVTAGGFLFPRWGQLMRDLLTFPVIGQGSSDDPDSQLKVRSKEEIGMMYLDHLFKLSTYYSAVFVS
jgi:vacuolar protein sorting-associated protein 41